jgi:prepilin peptidase CpaA
MTPDATITILKLTLAAAVSTAVVAEDLWHRRIPNPLCGLLLLIGTLSAVLSHGWSGLVDGLSGAALAFVVFLIPYLMGGLGGGDVKLMAGFGALTGLHGVVPALILAAVAGAGTAVLYLFWGRLRGKTPPNAIPYAPAIVAGSLLVAFSQIGGK